MKRRLFLSSGSAAVALTLVGCGGGGGGGTTTATASESATSTPTTPGETATTGDLPMGVQTGGAATSAPASGSGYAFGSRKTAYVAGVKPAQSAADMDAVLTKGYDKWKSKRVVNADSVVAGGYAVSFSDPTFMHVSEGMGYGMLLAVVFAGHDPDAKQLFDGLLAVARTRYAYGNASVNPLGKYLMDWRLYANGSSGGEGWNAIDGDLDMAMALLMADKQWGSGGKWNYLEEGKNTINAIKECCMRPDGTTRGLRLGHVSRTSDYMIGHFRAFGAATGDGYWNTAINRAFELTEMLQTKHSPGVGLIPDFVVYTDSANPVPSPGYMGDGNDNEDKFWWNACRNPWRFATDYLLHGDSRSKVITQRMIDFFQASSGGDPVNIGTGYTLWGDKVTGGNSPAYHAPICAGACIDAKYQGFADAMWSWNAKNMTTGYYDAEIQLLSMAVASGNWWSTV